MKKTFTKEYISSNCGCYAPARENKLHKCSFMKTDSNEVQIMEIIDSEIPFQDKFWFIVQFAEFTVEQRQEIAKINLEELRLIREEKFGKNENVDEFIQAAKDYVDKKISYSDLLTAERKSVGGGGVGGVGGVGVVGVGGVGVGVGVGGVGGGVGVVGVGVGVGVGVVGVVVGVGVGVGERLLNNLRNFIEKAL